MSIYWEVIVLVIVREKFHMNLCLILGAWGGVVVKALRY